MAYVIDILKCSPTSYPQFDVNKASQKWGGGGEGGEGGRGGGLNKERVLKIIHFETIETKNLHYYNLMVNTLFTIFQKCNIFHSWRPI